MISWPLTTKRIIMCIFTAGYAHVFIWIYNYFLLFLGTIKTNLCNYSLCNSMFSWLWWNLKSNIASYKINAGIKCLFIWREWENFLCKNSDLQKVYSTAEPPKEGDHITVNYWLSPPTPPFVGCPSFMGLGLEPTASLSISSHHVRPHE